MDMNLQKYLAYSEDNAPVTFSFESMLDRKCTQYVTSKGSNFSWVIYLIQRCGSGVGVEHLSR